MAVKVINFLGVKFYNENYSQVKKRLFFKKKSYLVIPAASSICNCYFKKNLSHLKSLQKSSVAILDSGLFCLCLLIFKFIFVKKFSGYKFLKSFLSDTTVKSKKILVLDSCKEEKKKNKVFLKYKKFKFIKHYICPFYNPELIRDKKLINVINNYKPAIVIINISGGVQECLALYLKENVHLKFTSICSGAALGFFSGFHEPINSYIDKFYLGWFVRVVFDPVKFIPRIAKSFFLVFIVLINSVTISYR